MLILLRHGESTANADRCLAGRMDVPLTERGRAQARALAPAASGAGRVITSPLKRARETAAALGVALPIEVDDRWVEVDYGAFDGRALGDIPPDLWAKWRGDRDFSPPGGESLAEAGARVSSACAQLFADEGDGARSDVPMVVVSHVTPIKAAVCWCLGLPIEGSWKLHLATASVTCIGWGAGGPVLHQFNHVPWDCLEQG